MQDTLCDLGHPALIEGVHPKVAADPAADIQLLLVPVATVGAFSDLSFRAYFTIHAFSNKK